MKPARPMTASRQRGIALVVTLLLLLIVTLLGLAAMRGTLLQERMAANAMARAFAFQAAEAVLREAEAVAAGRPAPPAAGCNNGICVEPTQEIPAWQAGDFDWEDDGRAGTEIEGIESHYVIEPWGEDSTSCPGSVDMSSPDCGPPARVYRITVRSAAPDGAEVMLQSLYRVP